MDGRAKPGHDDRGMHGRESPQRPSCPALSRASTTWFGPSGSSCTPAFAGYDGARSAKRPGAPVAELVDAADSKSVARKGVLVRVRPGAPVKSKTKAAGSDHSRWLRQSRAAKSPVWARLLATPR